MYLASTDVYIRMGIIIAEEVRQGQKVTSNYHVNYVDFER